MPRRVKQYAATASDKPRAGSAKQQMRKGKQSAPRVAASETRKAATVQEMVNFADSLQGILSYHNTHYNSHSNANHDADTVLAAARAAAQASDDVAPADLPDTVEAVMAMNAQAMEAIRAGQLDVGHDILTRVLHAAEQKLQQMPALLLPAVEGSSSAAQFSDTAMAAQVQAFNEWLAAYSVTLSNLGCQLHRAGKVTDALRCLQDARDVETHLYRTPSCSTMLNLSAVLLSAGDAVAALQIAQECVVAAQDADPVLFITALHNLAITLGQQGTQRERQAALPTMLRALREAQANLGEQDPTTLMLKEKCDTASRWIATAAQSTTTSQSGPAQGPRPTSGNSLQRNAAGSGRSFRRPEPHAQTLPEQSTEQRSRHRSLQSRDSATSLASSARRLGRTGSRRGQAMQSSTRAAGATTADAEGVDRFALPSISRSPSRQASGRSALAVGHVNKEQADMPLQQRARQAIETLDLGPATSLTLQARPKRETRTTNERVTTPAAARTTQKAAQDSTRTQTEGELVDKKKSSGTERTADTVDGLATDMTQGQAAGTEATQRMRDITLPALVVNTAASVPSSNNGSSPLLPCKSGDKAIAGVASLPLLARSAPQPKSDSQRLSGGSKNSSTSQASRASHKGVEGSNGHSRREATEAVTRDTTTDAAAAVVVPVNRLAHIVSPGAKVTPPPSFLRFVEADVAEAAPLPRTVPHASYQEMYAHLQHDAQAAAALREPPSAQEPGNVSEKATSEADNKRKKEEDESGGAEGGSSRKTSPARAGLFRPSSREREAEAERLRRAEAEFRLRREAARRAAVEEERWQAALQRIQHRTQNRAARVIQTVWRLWWAAVGQPRWVAQQEMQEQRMRRLRERRIRDALRFEPRRRRPTVLCAGFAPPEVVVRCGRRWLARTACVRYLAREHLLKPRKAQKKKSGAAVSGMWGEETKLYGDVDDNDEEAKGPERYDEATVRRLVVRLQAVWRGALARRHYASLRTHNLSDAALADGGWAGPDAAQRLAEERCYAAMVLQRAVRCMQARIRRATLLRDKLTPFALCIQRWYRTTLADQQRRGVDRVTVQHRNNAARCVQCAWRAYQARLRLYMLRLRRSMQACTAADTPHTIEEEEQSKALAIMPAAEDGSDTCKAETQHDDGVKANNNVPDVTRYTAYQEECLRRAPDVLQARRREREEYDVALYYAPRAERERQAWAEALRLRPFEVETRRATEAWHCELEQNTFRRTRAARCIQRAFRAWRRMRHDGYRDRTLLLHSRDVYRRAEYESVVIRRQYEKVQRRGRELYGDQVEPVRSSRALAEAERRALEATMPVSLSPSETPRTRHERAEAEKELQRDELLLRMTYPDDLARLRSDPVVVKENTGCMYEHPYYKMYHNKTHKQLLGIDP